MSIAMNDYNEYAKDNKININSPKDFKIKLEKIKHNVLHEFIDEQGFIKPSFKTKHI